jgi:hypothetical protein
MTSLDQSHGTTIIVSGKKAKLLDLLIAIVKEDPKETVDFHYREAKTLLLRDGYQDYLDDALNKIIALEYGIAIKTIRTPSKKEIDAHVENGRKTRADEDRKVSKAKALITERVTKIVMLDMQMPNGKKLRDCTGYECTKFGGMFVAIGQRIGAAKIVGDVLTEADLAKMAK